MSDPRSHAETDRIARVTLTIVAWFILNISIGNVTKWTFVFGKICVQERLLLAAGCDFFRFPFFVTVVHMLFSWAACFVYLRHVRWTLPGPHLGFQQHLKKVAPLAACVAGSFVAGNQSLKYIFPSFNQMLGSMTPLVTVLIACSFQGKRFSARKWLSILLICGGLVICSSKEVNFHALGVSCAVASTVLRAFKSLIQAQLLDGSENLDAVTLLYFMAPWSAAFLLLGSLLVEGVRPLLLLQYGLSDDFDATCGVLLLLGLGGLNACLLNVTNFQVTADTSAVTLNVLGNVKSVVGIGVSVLLFGNPFVLEQGVGIAVCLFGVYVYQMPSGPQQPSKPLARATETASDSSKLMDVEEGRNRPVMLGTGIVMPTAAAETRPNTATAS